jgi:hypothetical protein
VVARIAAEILGSNPDPVVRMRLEREVLHLPGLRGAADPTALAANPWVQQLASEQHPDGSWGRFHSQDTRLRQKIVTTEVGVTRGLALGLDAHHPCLQKALAYLAGLLCGAIEFPDPPERNDRWPTGARLFTAATLALLEPAHPLLDEPWALWAQIAERTFASGEYDAEAEIRAHRQLTGATVQDSYLTLHNKYCLAILSARPTGLPAGLADTLLRWLWQHPQGIRYLGMPLSQPPGVASPTAIDRWLSGHELLARFPGWRALAKDAIDWLWAQQRADGLWDFGARQKSYWAWPLSASWRNPQQRAFDHSTRLLALLR